MCWNLTNFKHRFNRNDATLYKRDIMKLLFVAGSYAPYVDGVAEVIKQISEGLVQRGHDVTVFTAPHPLRNSDSILNGVYVKSFKIRGNKVFGITGETSQFKQALINTENDILMNYAAQWWGTDITLDLSKNLQLIKTFNPCGYSALSFLPSRILYRNYFRSLPHYLNNYDRQIYHSAIYQDKLFGDKLGLTRYSIIPNGASEKEFEQCKIDFRETYNINTKYIIITVGNHHKFKGHKFVINAHKYLDRSDTTLLIIGNKIDSIYRDCSNECNKHAKNSKGLIRVLSELPRNHIISALLASNIFVFGSRVECSPLVAFEAMAAKLPIISTDVGNVRELEGSIIVRSPLEMANMINTLLNNEIKRDELGALAYDGWKSKYTWEKIVNKYESTFINLLNK